MNRPGRFFFSKKGGGLILLALTVFGGGWLYSQGRSGDGRLTPFWLPLVHQGQPTLAEIRVALQVAAPFSPDEGPTGLRALRETVWSVLRAPEENLFQSGGRNRMQETLTVRLNEYIFQGTLKGVSLEIQPWS
jgi:hypothetical protein